MAEEKKSSRNTDEPDDRVDIAGEVPRDAAASFDAHYESEQQILIAMDDDGEIVRNVLSNIPGEKVADGGGDRFGGGGGGKGGSSGDDTDSGSGGSGGGGDC